MAVWEIRPGDVDGRPVLVAADEEDVVEGVFNMDGKPKDWMHRPPVEYFTRVRSKKKQREPANVMQFVAGTFVLDAKARAALGGFLSRFGQLLELHRGGETLYAFNCTNLVDCLDGPGTQRDEAGTIILEAIDASKVPAEPTVFKDPGTAGVRNYVNDAAKEAIERWAGEADLTGLEIVPLDPI